MSLRKSEKTGGSCAEVRIVEKFFQIILGRFSWHLNVDTKFLVESMNLGNKRIIIFLVQSKCFFTQFLSQFGQQLLINLNHPVLLLNPRVILGRWLTFQGVPSLSNNICLDCLFSTLLLFGEIVLLEYINFIAH